MAIGQNTFTNLEHSIALGDGAKTMNDGELAAIGKTNVTKNATKTYLDQKINKDLTLKFFGSNVVGTVSLGNAAKDETRRIQNVAPGFIGEVSTDAINGSQLYAIMQNFGPQHITIASGGKFDATPNAFTKGTVLSEGDKIPLNTLTISFGNGLKAEARKNADGTRDILVGLIKDNTNDPGGTGGTTPTQGPKGDKGDAGAQDPKGDKGDAGAKGDKGDAGPKGKDGLAESTVNVVKESGKTAGSIKLDGTQNILNLKEGNNITVEIDKNMITVGTKSDVKFNSVTANTYKVGDKTYIDQNGINANNQRITNVAPGVNDTDGVNMSQLKGIKNDMFNIRGDIDKGLSMGSAIAALKPLSYNPFEKTQIMAGVGRYSHYTSYALGISVHSNENLLINGGVAFGTGNKPMFNAAITWRVGTEKQDKLPKYMQEGPITAVYRIGNKVDGLENQNANIEEKLAMLMAKIDEQEHEMDRLRAEIAALKKNNYFI